MTLVSIPFLGWLIIDSILSGVRLIKAAEVSRL
jgi:hypothetical protein